MTQDDLERSAEYDALLEARWESDADADREARRADNAEMQRDQALAALRPFAAAADGFEPYEGDHELASGWQRVTVNHLRQARTVLGLYGDRS